MSEPIRVTVWNEFWHENPQRHADVKSRLMNYGFSGERLINATEGVHKVYPDGMHTVIADHLREQGFAVRTATQDEPEHGSDGSGAGRDRCLDLVGPRRSRPGQ